MKKMLLFAMASMMATGVDVVAPDPAMNSRKKHWKETQSKADREDRMRKAEEKRKRKAEKKRSTS